MLFAFPRLSLDVLRTSGLPLDWMTVYVGWINAPDIEHSLWVSDDDVKYLAVDALAECDPKDENSLFRIADDTSILRTDLGDYLQQFAKKSGVSETTALRKWRYTFFIGSRLLETLTQWIDKERLPGGDYLPDVTDIDGETQWDIEHYVGEWNLKPEPPPIFGKTRTETIANLVRLRAWLAQEKAELMRVPTATTDGLPISVPPVQ